MKENSACPCKRECRRHGDCAACREHHHSWKRVPLTTCERQQTKEKTGRKKLVGK